MNKSKRISIILLCLIGLALSVELCLVYYSANFLESAKPSICAINDMFDCDSVARTQYSQFLGVPLAAWGIILYLFVLFLTFSDKLQKIKFFSILKVFKNPASYIFCISLLSFCISMTLAGISIFKINSVCIFCLMTYCIDLIIALVAKDWGHGILWELKNSIKDFIDAIKNKLNAFLFLIIVLIFAGILYYTNSKHIFTPQIIKQNEMLNAFKSYEKYANGYKLGPDNADVVIHEYIDFNCGGCFMANLYLHRIISEFENVQVIQHNVPLDKTCNHNMKIDGHKNSCLKSRYALAAEKQNKYWRMADILFAETPEDEKTIIEKARLANFDVKKLKHDANSEAIKKELEDSILEADSKEVNGTPTLFINMKKHLGIGSYPDFKALITEQGGKEKQDNK